VCRPTITLEDLRESMAAAGYEYVPFEDMLGGEVKIHEGKFTICRQVRAVIFFFRHLHVL
jgi:hypothetical protein